MIRQPDWGILLNIQRRIIALLLKLFQKTKEDVSLPSSHCEANIILIPKPNETSGEKKLQISLMNVDKNPISKSNPVTY